MRSKSQKGTTEMRDSRRSAGGGIIRFVLFLLLVLVVAGFFTNWFGYVDELPVQLPSIRLLMNDAVARDLKSEVRDRLDKMKDVHSEEFVSAITNGHSTDTSMMDEEIVPYVSLGDLYSVLTSHMECDVESVDVERNVAIAHVKVKNGDVVKATQDWYDTISDRSQWPSDIREMAAVSDRTGSGNSKLEARLADWSWTQLKEKVDEAGKSPVESDVVITYRRGDKGKWEYAGTSGFDSAVLGGSSTDLVKLLVATSAPTTHAE